MSTQNWPQDSTPRHATAGAAAPGAGAAGPGSSGSGSSTSDAAKGEAREVGKEGAEAGQHVADVAKGEAKGVAHEAKGQATNLVHELGDDLKSQAGTQQKKVAEGLRSVSEELNSMARNSEQSGTATGWVQEAGRRTGDMAGWLDARDPGSLLEETKRFARNRPGAFLAIAAGAGLLAGRLTRGLQDANDGGGTGASHGVRSAGSPQTYGSTHSTAYPAEPRVQPTSGADTVGGSGAVGGAGAVGGPAASGTGTVGAGTGAAGTRTPTAPQDQVTPDLASAQTPGYRPGFPDAEPGRPNPAFPDDDARGLNEGGDKR